MALPFLRLLVNISHFSHIGFYLLFGRFLLLNYVDGIGMQRIKLDHMLRVTF